MLRLIFVALLIGGFIYTTLEIKDSFIELSVHRIAQIETLTNQ